MVMDDERFNELVKEIIEMDAESFQVSEADIEAAFRNLETEIDANAISNSEEYRRQLQAHYGLCS